MIMEMTLLSLLTREFHMSHLLNLKSKRQEVRKNISERLKIQLISLTPILQVQTTESHMSHLLNLKSKGQEVRKNILVMLKIQLIS